MIDSALESRTSSLEEHTQAINDTNDEGYAEPVPESKDVSTQVNIWFIPHHGVSHPRKDTVWVVCG